jgi:kynurenine formamidase
MPRRIVDLSVALESGIASDPPGSEPKITYIAHKDPAALSRMLPHFPGLTQDELPGGEAWAVEQLAVSTHNGTHLDAPYHFHSTMDGGKRAWTIDEVPLEWCMGRGVKLDFRHLADGYVATPGDVEAELERAGVTLQPFDIVLVNTAAGARYGESDYVSRGCGMGRAATLWLTERGVRIAGTDAWSWDAPFVHTAKKYAATRDASLIWEGHRAGIERAYCHIEKLANLERLPATGYTVCCFPFKIARASAGFTRVVAIFEG